MDADSGKTVKVSGAMFQAFVNAGESLRLLLWGSTEGEERFDVGAWYPLDKFRSLLLLTGKYRNSGVILEQIGAEMTKCWYHQGPGKGIISSSIGFLRYQTGSNAFQSVINGPPEQIGTFALDGLDETGGTAVVRSTTLFPREMEKGILYGGLGLVGDLLYFDVAEGKEADTFEIFFVTDRNRAALSWNGGVSLDPLEWRLRHQALDMSKRELFWHSINDTLNDAFAEIKKAMERAKTLRGLLPICSACKKIRDDKGYWTQLEEYISKHSDADFTHGLCPSCAQRLYPDFTRG